MSNHFMSPALMWLLSRLGEERSSMSLAQILESPAVQVEQALAGLAAERLAARKGETQQWFLTPAGERALMGIAPSLFHKDAPPVTRLMAACDEGRQAAACEEGVALMRTLVHRADTAGGSACLELLLSLLDGWRREGVAEGDMAAFTRAALAVNDVALYLMKHAARSSACLETAAQHALSAGDKRTLVLLRFTQGCSLFFSGTLSFEQALRVMNSAMSLLETLGDKEMSIRATPFLILIHFVQGNFEQVLEWYDYLQKSPAKPLLPFMESQLVLQASSSAAYLGHFALAFGMIRSAISTAELAGQTMCALVYRQHMGMLLAYMRREDEARATLEAVISKSTMAANPKLILRTFATIALCHAQMGNVGRSYRVFSGAVRLAERHLSFSPSYNYLWILELGVLYELKGFAPVPGIDPDALFEKGAHSPSAMMRGHGLRCRAVRALHRGEDLREVLRLLDRSLSCLEGARTPVECAITHERRGVVLRRLGDEKGAAEAEAQAERLFSGLGIGKYSGAASPPAEGDGVSLLERCYECLSAIREWETLEEFSYQLAACLRRVFRGERSALFRLEGETPVCLGSCNISQSEILAEAFAPNREVIRKRLLEEEPFAARENGFDAVCVPFKIGDAPYLLYVDSVLSSSRIRRARVHDLRGIGFFFAAELRNALRVRDMTRINAEARQIHAVNNLTEEGKLEVWGRSAAFRHCLERARVVAATDAPVLLLGETGVGKEVMATFIHRNSGCKGPFVAVHPASVSESLFENEFFGHEKGAFTGAIGQKIGLFELADNGTLFIDEVGDVPMNMQIKLLRVLQEHTFMRVGGTKEIRSSFRLIAATNRDLGHAVREGTFREDLYYRISVVPLTVPPLRQRLDDLEELINAFVAYFSRRYGKDVPCPDAETLARLKKYGWPGNLRELRNVVERAVILHAGGPLTLTLADAHEEARSPARAETSLYADMPTLEELQRRYIEHILKKTGGRVCGREGAEHILGMKRSTLYLKLRQYGINTRDSRI